MKSLRFAACLLLVCGNVQAQSAVWQPAPGHEQIPIWPGTPPNALPHADPEFVRTVDRNACAIEFRTCTFRNARLDTREN